MLQFDKNKSLKNYCQRFKVVKNQKQKSVENQETTKTKDVHEDNLEKSPFL